MLSFLPFVAGRFWDITRLGGVWRNDSYGNPLPRGSFHSVVAECGAGDDSVLRLDITKLSRELPKG